MIAAASMGLSHSFSVAHNLCALMLSVPDIYVVHTVGLRFKIKLVFEAATLSAKKGRF